MRRILTISVAGALLVALVAVAGLLPVPYVTMSPGPTENTLGSYDGTDVIVISDETTYPTDGQLDMTTVSVPGADADLDIFSALRGWLDPAVAVVPREQIYPDDVDEDVVQQENAEQMQGSQENAIAAALHELDIPVTTRVVVQSITEGAPALGHLRAGDTILAVDGREVAAPNEVIEAVRAHEAGDEVVFTIDRDGDQSDVTVTTELSDAAAGEDGEPVVSIGAGIASAYQFPFQVDITLGEDIGGPSAGLVFALAIVDKLTPGALTNGAYVAGTGTIDADGVVGPIGGIQQKIRGAHDAGATVFLVPADDCAGAVAADIDGIRLVRVETLSGARDALEALAAGSTDVPACAG